MIPRGAVRPPFALLDQGNQFPSLRLPDSKGGLNSLPVFRFFT
jgi:hypothetical protein